MTHSELLWERFVLRTSAYAVQFAAGGYATAGKYNAERVRQSDYPLTLDVVKAHCRGEQCIGLYCLDVDKVKWIAIDIDGAHENPENARDAVRTLIFTCRKFGIVPLLEHSGKKGWRLWIFTEAISSLVARAVGLGIIAEAGEEGKAGCSEVECFPKQLTTHKGGNAYGNLVKLPWGKRADNGNRGLFADPDTLEVFDDKAVQFAMLELAETYSEEFLSEVAEENGWIELAQRKETIPPPQHPLPDGVEGHGPLPCYQLITDWDQPASIPQGARNKIFYALASQERRMGRDQRTALLSLIDINNQRCSPIYDKRELEATTASVYKSGFVPKAGCEVLQENNLCPAKLHGLLCPLFLIERKKQEPVIVALAKDDTRFSISPLRKLETDPAVYTATIWGQEVVMSSDILFNWRAFKVLVGEKLNRVPTLPEITVPDPKSKSGEKALPPDAVWTVILNEALEAVIIEEPPPEDASASGIAWGGVVDFINARTLSENRDDLAKGHVFTCDGFIYFKGPKLLAHMKLNGTDVLPPNRLWKMIQGRGGKNTVLRTSSGSVRVWAVPSSSITLTPDESMAEPETEPQQQYRSSLGL